MKTEYKVLLVSLVLGGAFWVFDAVLDSYWFYAGPFAELLLLRIPPHELYIRLVGVGLFLLGGAAMAAVMAQRNRAEERLEHLNAVLSAIRNVNQLITHENDPDRLIAGACVSLTETLGYNSAWIALIDAAGRVTATALLPEDETSQPMRERLANGTLPVCAKRALESGRLVVVEKPQDECEDCSLASRYEAWTGLSAPLTCEGRTFGVLTVSVPSRFGRSEEDHQLFEEVAGDLGFALGKIQAEEQLRLQAMILSRIQDQVTLTDLEGRIVYVNEAEAARMKRSPDDLIGQSVSMYGDDPGRGATQQEIVETTLSEGKWQGEVVNYDADGAEMFMDSRTWLIRDEKGHAQFLCGVGRDITERKRAENRLEDSERAMQTLLGNLPGMVYRCMNEPEWPLDFVSEGCESLTGYTCQELTGPDGAKYGDLIHPDDRQDVWDAVQEGIAGGVPFQMEYRIRRKDGRTVWVWERGQGVTLDGQLVTLEGFISDVSERKRAEQGVREGEERFRRALSFAPFPLMIHAEDGQVIFVNEAWTALTGYRLTDIPTLADWARKAHGHGVEPAGTGPKDLYHADDPVYEGEVRLYTTSGEERIWDFNSAPLGRISDGRRAVISCAVDITRRRALEDQLRQAQKMEAVGQLAGGVAHDFNNILQALQGYSEFLLESLEPQSDEHEFARQIRKGTERAASLTRQLLAFSRRQVLDPRNLDVNALVSDLLKMIIRTLGEHIELTFRPMPDKGIIYADPGQVEQVLMNLCVNARDAMPEGGSLLIETDKVEIDEDYCRTHADARPGRYIVLSVTDTGSGMDEKTLRQVFEPFFTTKEQGKGTGLGLATVFGIVKQHDGLVHVYSEPGKGASFRLYFPETVGAVTRSEESQFGQLVGGTERILIAEDDTAVRELAIRVLGDAGYTVFAAADGESAIRLVDEHGDSLDLAVLDVVMPRVGGQKVHEHIKEHVPGLPVLFSSGYSANAVHTNFVLKEGLQLIQKPYAPSRLLRRIRDLLDSRSAPAD